MATTLGKKTRDIVTALSLFGLLAACALMSTSVRGENMVGHAAIRNATAQGEHKSTCIVTHISSHGNCTKNIQAGKDLTTGNDSHFIPQIKIGKGRIYKNQRGLKWHSYTV